MGGRLRPRPPRMQHLPRRHRKSLALLETPHPEVLGPILGQLPFLVRYHLWRSEQALYPLWAYRLSRPPCLRLHSCHPNLPHLCIRMHSCLRVLDPSPQLEVLHITVM